jgi:hypothetical protein
VFSNNTKIARSKYFPLLVAAKELKYVPTRIKLIMIDLSIWLAFP